MTKRGIAAAVCLIFWAFAAASVSSTTIDSRKLREFGNVDWESEMLFLDSLDNTLREKPESVAYVIVYGGRRGDRRGETRARIACIKDYMLNRRGVKPDRIVMVNGGYRKESTVELWLVSRGERGPSPTPTINPKEVRFRKDKIQTWRCRCNI